MILDGWTQTDKHYRLHVFFRVTVIVGCSSFQKVNTKWKWLHNDFDGCTLHVASVARTYRLTMEVVLSLILNTIRNYVKSIPCVENWKQEN